MTDGEADDVGLDLLERADVAVIGVEQHAKPARAALAAVGLVAEQFGKLREAVRGQRLALFEDAGAEQCGLQLANIARPVVAFDQAQPAVGDRMVLEPRLLADLGEEVPRERGDIAEPLAQRGHADARDGKLIEQRPRETARNDFLLEVEIAGGEDAQVDLEAMRCAGRADDAAVEHIGQPLLLVARYAVDVVEDQRAPVALLEQAGLAVEGTREGTLLVPEQQRFERGCGQAAAAHHAQIGLGTGAGGMHRAGDHVLAGSAFALDQHMRVATRGSGGLGQRGAERCCGSDHVVEIERVGQPLGQRLQFGIGLPAENRARQRAEQALGIDRLDEIVGCARAHRFDRKQRRRAGGEHQQGKVVLRGPQFADQLAGAVARDPLVEQYGRDLFPFGRGEQGECIRTGGDDLGAPALAGGERGHQPPLGRVVVDQQQQARLPCGHGLLGSPSDPHR